MKNCLDSPNLTELNELADWETFKSDLVLEVHHILTEPTCPTAKIRFEIPQRAGLDILSIKGGNSIQEAIDRLKEHKHLIEQKKESRS